MYYQSTKSLKEKIDIISQENFFLDGKAKHLVTAMKKKKSSIEGLLEMFYIGFEKKYLKRAEDVAICEFVYCSVLPAIKKEDLQERAEKIQDVFPECHLNLYNRINSIAVYFNKLEANFHDRYNLPKIDGAIFFHELYRNSKHLVKLLEKNAEQIKNTTNNRLFEAFCNRNESEAEQEVFSYLLQLYTLCGLYRPSDIIRKYGVKKK